MFVFTWSYQALRFHLVPFRNRAQIVTAKVMWTILLQRSVKAMAYCDFSIEKKNCVLIIIADRIALSQSQTFGQTYIRISSPPLRTS
jgi:hypothetical protein